MITDLDKISLGAFTGLVVVMLAYFEIGGELSLFFKMALLAFGAIFAFVLAMTGLVGMALWFRSRA